MTRSRRGLPVVREVSAGGLVVDDPTAPGAGVLIAHRVRGGELVWTLPKGHLESGESPQEAAAREVAEETGLTATVLGPLGVVDYWFVSQSRRIHKWVHHFVLTDPVGELSTHDVEVEQVAWVPLEEIDARLRYRDERALVARLATVLGTGGT